jgi:hypothetical protein
MGDSGEGLVDASSRLEEQREEIEESRSKKNREGFSLEPETIRAMESLRMAKVDLERQIVSTTHEVRRKYLQNALAEIDRSFDDLKAKI